MSDYTTKDLQYWEEKIEEKAAEFGLSWYPQEFEVCNHVDMLNAMAYSGMPANYPHWSFGKTFERTKTLYDYGVSGLPYEMVINSSPTIAYLMRDNSLLLQILTMAHVYGHNDFFKNNFTLKSTRAELVLSQFKTHADRVRRYAENHSIGQEKVEHVLDAAHALALQCRRNLGIKKSTPEEQKDSAAQSAEPRHDPFARAHKRPEYVEPDLKKVPLEPEEDILLFIRDYNPYLSEWEKDLLTIVHEREQYFIPQIETKIMNEGWASFWHREIVNSIELPESLHMEFLVRHNQVVRPFPRQINPYFLGLKLWDDIKRRHDEPAPEEIEKYGKPRQTGMQAIFAARETDRDVSFLRRFLTEELMRKMDMFEHEKKDDTRIISAISDKDGWKSVKETLLKSVGMGSVPVIKIHDADYGNMRTLFLVHDHEGRDLQLEYAEKTLGYMFQLWGREVVMESTLEGRTELLTYNEKGFSRSKK